MKAGKLGENQIFQQKKERKIIKSIGNLLAEGGECLREMEEKQILCISNYFERREITEQG